MPRKREIISIILGAILGSALFSSRASPRMAVGPAQTDPASTAELLPEEIRQAKQELADLGYWVVKVDDVFDTSARHALTAFQKVEGRPRTGKLNSGELAALATAHRPTPYQGGPSHVEIDITRQVLFLVNDNGTVVRILPVSTGSSKLFTSEGRTRKACTPCGTYRIDRKIDGWRRSPLGLLYYPSYFHHGVAIHGNPTVPPYPASHGCVRIPMFAAKEFNRLTPIGTVVIVHEGEDTQ